MVVAAGFSHCATQDNSHLDAVLDDLPLERLRDVATAIMTPMYPALRQARLQVLANDPPDRGALRNFILKSVVQQGPGYALVAFDVLDRTGNFIKTSTVALDETAGRQTLDLLRQLPSPQASVFMGEAAAIHAKKHGAKPEGAVTA